MRFPAFVLLIFLTILSCRAQQAKYTAFTVNDGLPSNYIYRCIEDNKGFLWVATDAGIARFDGKHFQVFTTKQGLPDNEVLAVVKEKNGRIWVNCFKQRPAYFDEVKNRFINASEDSTLAKISEATSIMLFFPLENGGMLFFNEKGSYLIKDNKLETIVAGPKEDFFLVRQNNDGSQLKYGATVDPFTKKIESKIYWVKGDRYLDSIVIGNTRPTDFFTFGLNDGKFYMLNGSAGKCYIYDDFGTNPMRIRADSVKAPEPFNNFEFNARSFYLLGNSGKTYLFNKHTLKLEAIISGDYLTNSLFNDSRGNLWVSTVDKGLLVYKKNQFDKIPLPAGLQGTNFLSIAHTYGGTILAGNFLGEVVEAKSKMVKINHLPKTSVLVRERKILFSQNKIFTLSESGIYVNYTRKLGAYGKTGITYNDSIIIVGQTWGLLKVNTITEKCTGLKAMKKRVTAMARASNGMVYFGSTDGLYSYNYVKNETSILAHLDPLLSERITGICGSTDGLVWVATSGSGIVIMKDNRVLLNISQKDGIINNASRCITCGKPGQVWLGTAAGISVINYTLQHNYLHYTIQNLSVNDGLTNNVVNEMVYTRDTIYAATGRGVSVVPANISIPKFNIPVQLTGMTINQRDTILSSNYKLNHDQQNIRMQFAGIELSGHFKNLQYRLEKNANWIDLDDNTLTVELGSGPHIIQIRAVDVNGNSSNKILTIQFNIATPYWKSLWFWLINAFILQLAIVYVVNRQQKRSRETKLAREIASVQTASLEQQAFTSLMNPHFMFNALNSIQHYINVQDRQNANRYLSDFASLIRKNFEAAQQSFVALEQEMENIKIYLRLEQMRFNNRFAYQIIIYGNLDTEEWMIPTMILQPLLENALLHGIMPSAIDGNLVIELKEEYDSLLIIITDNGIGITNSHALKESESKHKSHGVELIEKRIAALSRFGTQAVTIAMSRAFESDNNPGNKIILVIPRGLYQAWLKAQKRR